MDKKKQKEKKILDTLVLLLFSGFCFQKHRNLKQKGNRLQNIYDETFFLKLSVKSRAFGRKDLLLFFKKMSKSRE